MNESGKALMKKIISPLFFVWLMAAYADDVPIEPQGEYAKIDTRKSVSAIQNIMNANPIIKAWTIYEVKNHPGNYAPPVLCALASSLARDNKIDDGIFWFYACKLRALSDVNKSDDASAKSAYSDLGEEYGVDFKDKNLVVSGEEPAKTVKKVIEWDKETPRNYDPRWFMLYGMGAFLGSEFNFAPESEWAKINEMARQDFMHKTKDVNF